ncbi:MAG: PAS domain S-box protein, partial [Rhodospirillaceae bacterium]|nr:PAS domain S-box protein [Rhodospirillaceae bacterium]
LSPDATFIQSDYKLVFANDAFLRQVGAGSLNEVIGIPLIDFVHPDHRDKVSARRENMFASDEPIAPVEVKRLRLDGSEYYAEIAAARLTWEGKPAAQVVCRDITDRKRVEDKLRESEQRYRGVVDMSPEAAIVYVDRRLVFANQAFLDQVGASSLDKVLGKLSEDFIHLGDREASQARREEMLISNQPIGLTEIRRLRLDGTEYPAEVAATQLLWNGKPAIQLVCRDITDRHIAEEKLLESEARYRRVVTLSPDATFIQLDYKLVFANDAFLRQVGAGSLDEVIGKSLYDFIHPDEREKVSARRKNMFASDEPIAPVEVKRLRLDGSEYYAEIAAARLTWDGKPAAQVVCRDITERKKIESALQAAMDDAELASRAKSEFLAGMSHELRTPLNAIIGFSDIMKKEALGPVGSPRYREYAGDIHSSGEHLLALINDILDISKIEAGEGELHEDNVDLADIVRSCATMIKERAHKGGIALMTDGIDGTVPSLRADPRRLKQILINLMSNAVKFTEAAGTVTIKVWHNPVSGHVIQCIDTGIGIAVDDIPKALAQFQQVDGTLSREQEGTGLGLPLTKSLVELHGGTLDLQSEIDKGTTVTVKLPVDRTVSSDGIAQSA